MPNEILIKIKVDNESAKGYEEALAEARAFGGRLKEEMDRAGKEAGNKAADEIKRQLEEAKPPAVDVTVDTEKAKEEIKGVEEELRHLDHEDANIEVDLHTEKAKVEAKVLKEELKHDLSDSGSSAGSSWGKSFADSLKSSSGDFKPGLMQMGLTAAAVFAPLIGGSIAAAVVGGLGLSGIVGGVVIAAHDPRVKSAFASMKTDLGAALKLDAAPFVPVVVSAIGQIERTVKGIDLAGIFRDLAPQVRPVLNGILDLVTSLGGAIRNVAANSGPVMEELGTDFRNFGATLAAAFNSLTDNGKQEAQALHDLFGIIDGAITITFDLVNALTEMYSVFHKISADTTLFGFYELMQDHSQKISGAVHDTVTAVQEQIDANHSLAGSAKQVAEAAKAETKAIQDTADALKAATDPAFALMDAQKQVNTAQSAYNKAVKTGGENSKAAKAAQTDLDKAMINYVGAAAKAEGGTGHLTTAQKNLLKAAGASSGTIKDLDNKLYAAWKQAQKLDGFNIDINVNYHRSVTGPEVLDASGHRIGGYASGGIAGAASGATSSGLTWVGERGPELMSLPPGTAVHSAGDSKRIAGSGMDAAGGPMIVQLHVDGHVIAQAMVDPQRKFVQQNFGGSVQAAYGVGV